MKNRNSMREIVFHTLFCMVSMVSILLTMQKKYTSESDPLQAQIIMREFQFFESIIEKNCFYNNDEKTDMILIYGERGRNSVAAADVSKPMVDTSNNFYINLIC
jgi:hypothetical protein